jgi:hypothetical protein
MGEISPPTAGVEDHVHRPATRHRCEGLAPCFGGVVNGLVCALSADERALLFGRCTCDHVRADHPANFVAAVPVPPAAPKKVLTGTECGQFDQTVGRSQIVDRNSRRLDERYMIGNF